MPEIPTDSAPDSTLALLSDGYAFIAKRCQRLQSDVFQTRLLFQKTICMQGGLAARTFYEPGYFQRGRATPTRVQKTLIGQGGGGHHENHRCAGEWIIIELMKRAVAFLAGRLQYDLPVLDLSISPSRMPAIPKSRFIIRNVELEA